MNTFIIYMTVVAIALALIYSKKFRAFFVSVVLCASMIYGAIALQNAAMAEERSCKIIEFKLNKSVFVLQDEDGFKWEFFFGKDSYKIGDKYILHLEENKEPWIEKEAETK